MKNNDNVRIRRFFETGFVTIIERRRFVYGEVTPKRVGEYLLQLKIEKDSMVKSSHLLDTVHNLKTGYVGSLLMAFDYEIELAEFYLEQHKAKKSPFFDSWIFLTEEERNKNIDGGWMKKKGNAWIRRNGKVKAIVALHKETASTKVSLIIENDSKLSFTANKLIASTNLRNNESINRKIEGYKSEADGILSDIIFPRHCPEQRRFDILKKLLDC